MCLAKEEVEEKHDIGVQVLLYKVLTLSFFLLRQCSMHQVQKLELSLVAFRGNLRVQMYFQVPKQSTTYLGLSLLARAQEPEEANARVRAEVIR